MTACLFPASCCRPAAVALWRAVRALLALLLGMLLTGGALAHGLRVSAQAEADGLRGQAFYADGSPARDETVSLFVGDSTQPQAQTRTDADGRFRLLLSAAGRYRVVVDGDEGHRAEAAIVWAPLTAAAASGAGAAAADSAQIAAAVRAEVAPLREDIARLHARIRLSDLVGGIGLIVGAVGALAWWRTRRGTRG